jgi:hypothetical protein
LHGRFLIRWSHAGQTQNAREATFRHVGSLV